MLQIHPNARTTPAFRVEIARSGEPTGVLARRFGVSMETIRKWRKCGPADCQNRSARPHRLSWKATEEGCRFDPQALLCTDLAQEPLQVVHWFVQPWQLEVTFREVYDHLGVETQRQ